MANHENYSLLEYIPRTVSSMVIIREPIELRNSLFHTNMHQFKEKFKVKRKKKN